MIRNRPSPTHTMSFAVVTLLSIAVLSGCCTRTLNSMQTLQSEQQYVELAQTKIDCESGTDCCNQQHFLKGDACFILAKNPGTPETDYANYLQCASANLFSVVDNTADWSTLNIEELSNTEKEIQVYRNGLESIRLRTSLSDKSQALSEFNQRAKEFIELAPEDAGANYYFILNSLYVADQQQLACPHWRKLKMDVDAVLAQFGADPEYGTPIAAVKVATETYLDAQCQ